MALPNISLGASCSTNNDHIDPGSGRFSGDCGDTGFCSGPTNGTCQPRQCRRDEFPFGFDAGAPLPPLCKDGFYCPDEGSGCKPLLLVGQTCQVDRDEQCAPPPNARDLAGNASRSANGSVCLKSTCACVFRVCCCFACTEPRVDRYANRTLGQPCVLDIATYTDGEYRNIISRHNCRTPRFYCHGEYNMCIPTQRFGEACASAQECRSVGCPAWM